MPIRTVDEIMTQDEIPAVAIDHDGVFIHVNAAFSRTYEWRREDLIGHPITLIMPPHMRDTHNFGFSRFLLTESPRILDQPLALPVLRPDGSVVPSKLYITSEKKEDLWRFAATLEPDTRSGNAA